MFSKKNNLLCFAIIGLGMLFLLPKYVEGKYEGVLGIFLGLAAWTFVTTLIELIRLTVREELNSQAVARDNINK